MGPSFVSIIKQGLKSLRETEEETADLSTTLRSGRDDKFVVVTRFRVSRKGPRNCRSLGFARDDKGKGDLPLKGGFWTEVMKNAFGPATTFNGRSPSPLSSRLPRRAVGAADLPGQVEGEMTGQGSL
jgi:hypothetical protein